jgi:hypothetical protein
MSIFITRNLNSLWTGDMGNLQLLYQFKHSIEVQ